MGKIKLFKFKNNFKNIKFFKNNYEYWKKLHQIYKNIV